MARLVATISVIEPVAQVGYTLPVAQASYQLPLAQVGYILLVAAAEKDTSGRYRFVADLLVTTDRLVLQLGKSLQDAVGLTDATARHLDKAMLIRYFTLDDFFAEDYVRDSWEDFADMRDVFRRVVSYRRAFQDTAPMLDSQARAVAKALADNFTAADQTRLLHAKLVRDVLATVDAQSKSTSLAKTDSTAVLDAATRQTSLAKTDIFNFADSKNFSLAKQIIDGFALNDSALIGDGIAFVANKFIANVIFALDAQAVNTSKLLRDSIGTQDSAQRVNAKVLADTSYLSDAQIRFTSKALQDAYPLADTQQRASAKRLLDAFAVGDTPRLTASKLFGDSMQLLDSANRVIAKTVNDGISFSDSGALMSQGYSDMSYFSTDYVGASRQF